MACLIDTHLHLGRSEFDLDRDAVTSRAEQSGVAAFLHVGFDRPSIAAAQELAARHAASWCTAGIHPHEAQSYDDSADALLHGLARAGAIVAIGECGLDYFRDLSPRAAQHDAFVRQIQIARDCDRPLVLHVRDAHDDVRTLLQREGLPRRRGVFHAFSGDAAFARWAVDEGFALGIGGPLTYPRGKLAAAIAGLPAQAFLLETDAPWLPPQPWRGQRNEPAYARVTAEALARQCGQSLDALAQIMAERFMALFDVRLPDAALAVTPSALPLPPGAMGSR